LALSLSLSEADAKRVADKLAFLKSSSGLSLPKPVNTTGPASLATKLDPVGSNPKFSDIGIGVVDFTSSMTSPKVWLHNEDTPWRVGSTGKIAILLAAVQLREDVRQVKTTGLVSSAADFDELFATIWKRSKFSTIQDIADVRSSPRISTIFDLTKSPINFMGADTPLDKQGILDRLPVMLERKRDTAGNVIETHEVSHLMWTKQPAIAGHPNLSWAPHFSFWERMWLTASQSDNVAATSCVSEMGVAYLKAAQREYGLFDPTKGKHLLLASGYGGVGTSTPVTTAAGAPKYRLLRNTETHTVTDKFKGSKESTQPGSTAALTAYMIGLMQNKIAGTDGSDTVRTHLADETDLTATSLIYEGVNEITTVTKAHTKLGILGALRCEFAYIEADGRKYGVAATGILPKRVGSTRFSEEDIGRALGKAIHTALTTP
jgi:hypothetical protein